METNNKYNESFNSAIYIKTNLQGYSLRSYIVIMQCVKMKFPSYNEHTICKKYIFSQNIDECNLICIARFIIGFFIGGVPWYIGAFILACVQMDYQEKSGLIACTIAVSVFHKLFHFHSF